MPSGGNWPGRWSKKSLVATQKPTSQEIAWAAGLYEGEGYCDVHGSSERVLVSQKDTWILEKLKILFGGTLQYPSKKSTTPCSNWEVYGGRARGFLMTIYSFLSPRRREQIKKKGIMFHA